MLVTIQGPDLGRAFSLDRDSTILGRQHDSDICLSGRAISRHHARIVRQNGTVTVEDLDSSNGTFVNGQRLSPHTPTPLTERDALQIGPYVFAVRLHAAPLKTEANLVIRETMKVASAPSQLFGPDATGKLQGVLEISQQLARTLDLDQLLEKVLEQVLKLFPQADRGLAILVEGDQLSLRAQKSRRPDREELPFSRTIVRRALHEGVGLISDDVKNDQRFVSSATLTSLDLRSMMCVPMFNAEQQPLGVLQVDRYGKGFGFLHDDLELLTAVGMQVAVAVDNAYLHAERLHEQRLHQEIAVARDIQQGFLPDELEDFPNADFDICGRVYPARQVAGDWYDFLKTPAGQLGFFLGDVSGKGMPAALFLVAVRTLCRHLVKEGRAPVPMLQALNRDLADDNPQCMFVTLIHGLFDPKSGVATLASAGHHPPLLRRASGAVEPVPLRPGRLLGYEGPDLRLHECKVTLHSGDTLVFFTDGVIEARAPDGKTMFGAERLEAAVRELAPTQSLRQCIRALKEHLDQFTAIKELQDDVTLLLLRRN